MFKVFAIVFLLVLNYDIAVWAFCENETNFLVAKVEENTLVAPNYGNQYPDLFNCSWKVSSDLNSRVYIQTKDVDLDANVILSISTDGNEIKVDSNLTLFSLGNTLDIFFTPFTNVSDSTEGFSFTYRQVCPGHAVELQANETHLGYIESPFFQTSHPLGLACSWKIITIPQYDIYVRILEFKNAFGKDLLQISDNVTSYDFSQDSYSEEIPLSGDHAVVEFRTAENIMSSFMFKIAYFASDGRLSHRKSVLFPSDFAADFTEDFYWDSKEEGSEVYFISDGVSRRAAHNTPYNGDGFSFFASSGSPSVYYYHISTKDSGDRRFAIQVISEYDARGFYSQNHFASNITDGEFTLSFHSVLLQSEVATSFYEVYFAIHLSLPQSGIKPRQSFTIGFSNKQKGDNTFTVQGQFQRSIVGYTRISVDVSGFWHQFLGWKPDKVMKQLLTVFGNDSYYKDFCYSNPCKNGATCLDIGEYYSCICEAGFTSKHCSINIDDCSNQSCTNGGICIDMINDYMCSCAPGYTSMNCSVEIDECTSSPCGNNAVCQDLLADFKCICTPGFTGRNCFTDVDDCESSPCKNNATCNDLVNDYECLCKPGFFNKNCSHESCPLDDIYLVAKDPEKFVNSLKYPLAYPGGLNCSWKISTQAGYRIYLEANDIELGTGDFLIIQENGWTLGNFSIMDSNFSLYTTGSTTDVRFVSQPNPNATYQGFSLSYRKVCPGQAVELQANGTHFGLIESPYFQTSHPPNLLCSWRIALIPQYMVYISVNELKSATPINILEVKNNESKQEVDFEKYNDGFYLTGEFAVVEFRTNDVGSNFQFKISYIAVCSEHPVNLTTTRTHQVIYTHQVIAMLYYDERLPTNLTCNWILWNPNHEDLFVRVLELNLGRDNSLFVYYDNELQSQYNNSLPKNTIIATYNKHVQLGLKIKINRPGIRFKLEYFSHGLPSHKKEIAFPTDLTANVTNFYPYIYDGVDLIEDGGHDMFDKGNEIYEWGNGSWIRMHYNTSVNRDDYTFTTYSAYPFLAYYHISTTNTRRRNYGIKVESDYGADGYGVQKKFSDIVTDGNNNLSYTGVQIFGTIDPTEPSPGEATPVDTIQIPYSDTRYGFNNFSVEGTFRHSIVGYTLLSKYPSAEIEISEISLVMERLLAVFGNDSYYKDFCHSFPCENGGTCTDIVEDYSCVCVSGYTSKDCSVNIDECALNSCANNGTCIDGINNYTCDCMPGYTTSNCSVDIDECACWVPCKNNATCIDLVNDFRCDCLPGYTGRNCSTDIDNCTSSTCFNNGTCVDLVNGFKCICAPGYSQENCSVDINECELSPCENNAPCKDKVNDFYCECLPGYSDKDCSKEIDECSPNPCRFNSTCTDRVNGYDCLCQPGYTGENCYEDINECKSSPCVHNETCIDLINDYNCSCKAGYTDKRCITDINECESNPCQNEAEGCDDQINGYKCYCRPHFTGINCEIVPQPCKDVVCAENAICRALGYVDHECTCLDGFEGDGKELCQPFCAEKVLKDKNFTYTFEKTGYLESPGSTQKCNTTGRSVASALCKLVEGSTLAEFADLKAIPVDITSTEAVAEIIELKLLTSGATLEKSQVDHITKVFVNLTETNVEEVEIKAESLYNTIAIVDAVSLVYDNTTSSVEAAPAKQKLSTVLQNLSKRAVLPPNQTSIKVNSENIAVQIFDTDTNHTIGNRTVNVNSIQIQFQPKANTRYSFVAFSKATLFPSTENASAVIAIQKKEKLVRRNTQQPNNIIVNFMNKKDPSGVFSYDNTRLLNKVLQARCGAWNEKERRWSKDGCVFVKGSEPPECLCSKFTTYSLIVEEKILPSAFAMHIFTYVGTSLSVFCLVLTMFLYIYSRTLRRQARTVYVCNISFCILIYNLIFITGGGQTDSSSSCYVVAVLLHYFLLASWCWMTANALVVFYQLMTMISTSSLCTKLSAIISYVFPAVTVLITLAVAVFNHDIQNYKSDDAFTESAYRSRHVCWLHMLSLRYGFLLPVGIMLAINMIIFVIVIGKVTLSCSKLRFSKPARKRVSKFTIAITLIFSTGLTWVFGYLMLVHDHVIYQAIMAWLFTIFNSTQGIFIFVVNCVLRRNVQAMWLKPLQGIFGTNDSEKNGSEEPTATSRVEALRKLYEG